MKKPKKVGPSAEETALKEVSNAQWNDYVTRFVPAEKELIRRADKVEDRVRSARSQVSADVASTFEGVSRNTALSNKVAGADANSGRTKMSLAQDATGAGAAKGQGQAMAGTDARLQQDERKLSIAAMGREIQFDAVSDMSRGAQRATQLALNEAENSQRRADANLAAAATVAGAAWGKLKSHKLSKEVDAAAAADSSTEGMSGADFGIWKQNYLAGRKERWYG